MFETRLTIASDAWEHDTCVKDWRTDRNISDVHIIEGTGIGYRNALHQKKCMYAGRGEGI